VVAGALAMLLSAQGAATGLPAPGAGWVAGVLALGALFLASNLALQFGAARLPANVTAVVMLTEVLFASVSALALGAGTLDARLVIGGAAIVASAVLAALEGRD
jgi:drug/metabolite transporter (DMT)-like permease